MPIIVDHNARTCSNRRTCKPCSQNHPTGLHGYAPKRRGGSNIATTSSANPTKNDNLGASSVQVVSNFAEMDIKCASAKIPAKIISMCVAPVKIGHVRTKKELSTLAILNNCSQGTFMKENIKKKLGISGSKTEITIKILNGKQNMESTVVTWLKVCKNGHGEGVRWLNFPAKHTREALRKGFIEDLLIKGYAKNSTEKPPDGQTWYIPHHGVYHPNKPGIINCRNLVKGLQKWSW